MTDPLHPDRIAELIEGFSRLGIHRTGWPADDQSTAWMRDWLRAQGVAAHSTSFRFPKVRWEQAQLTVAGVTLEGVPLYDAQGTASDGLHGRLCAIAPTIDAPGRASFHCGAEHAGALLVIDCPGLPDLRASLMAAAAHGVAGVILVSGDPQGQIVLRNAEHLREPVPLPVLQVARAEAGALLAHAQQGESAVLRILRHTEEASASNLIARIPAPAAQGQVVLMTPKSGWFGCAAERGGGIALTMLLAAIAAGMPGRRRDLCVLFTSGHELGHWGLRSHLSDEPQLRTQTGLWIHLGASIGARHPMMLGLFSREPVLRDWFQAQLNAQGVDTVTLMPPQTRPGGESREVFEHPFVSLAGHHRYFHSPQDLPEIAADPASVARFGRALLALLTRALCEPEPLARLSADPRKG